MMTVVVPTEHAMSVSSYDRIAAKLVRASGIRNRLLAPKKLEEWAAKPRTLYHGQPSKRLLRTCAAERATFDGWTVYEVTPRSAASSSGRAMLFLHGGAYVRDFMGFPYWNWVAKLATQTGRTVIVPIYPLAPEHTHRDVFPTLIELYRDILTRYEPHDVAFAGDSAGGGLALGLAHELRDKRIPQPASIVTFSPWVDLGMDNPAIAEVEKVDPILNPRHLAACGRLWAGGDPLDSPSLSPVHASLEGLGRVTVFSGTCDVLWPDARRLHERALAEGIEHGWYEVEGATHAWIMGKSAHSPDWRYVVQAFEPVDAPE